MNHDAPPASRMVDESSTPEEKKTARQEAVERYRQEAIKATMLQVQQTGTALIGLIVQIRALGGKFCDPQLARALRETAEWVDGKL